jgi:hypothetical protein
MDKITLTGTITDIFPIQQVSTTFSKREFILETDKDTKYPESIKIEVTEKSLMDKLDQFLNDEAEVFINIRGRKWTNPKGEDVYFNSIVAWRIQVKERPAPPNKEDGFFTAKEMKHGERQENKQDDSLPF